MTVKATGVGVPPSRRTMEALKRRNALVEKYVAEGMGHDAALERAQSEMRDNDKGDWRRG